MKLIQRKDLHIEDIRTDEYWNRLRIFSILGKEDYESKLRTHYIIRQSLYTKTTVLNICKGCKINDWKELPLDDLYEVSNRTYIVDNIPIYTFLKLSSIYSDIFLKLRDWKYLNRDSSYFVRIPTEVCEHMEIRKEYENIQLESIRNYWSVAKRKGSDYKELALSLLPLGIQHRAVLSTTLNSNIELTNSLLCSDMVLDNQLGDMFENLLKTDMEVTPDCTKRLTTKKILEYLKDCVSENQSFDFDNSELFKFEYITDMVEQVFTNFEMLINPLGSKDELEFDYEDQLSIGKIIKKGDIGHLGFQKGSALSGFLPLTDIFEILVNNYTIYIPLLSDFINIDKELERKDSQCYLLPESIKKYPELKKDMNKDLMDTYTNIKSWRKKSKEHMSDEMSKEFTRYLLPLSHMTKFNMYLDIKDIFNLKNSNLNYSEQWNKLFFQKDPLFKK
ncbi:hypothetical protein K8R14_00615 [bacterium]|nr:hypothetical protein [bacterium]